MFYGITYNKNQGEVMNNIAKSILRNTSAIDDEEA